ncbi:EboA domain-containing protein [Longispora sp. K20-0274]|uniref:EboA domain-containing protein n=1 Tax=Longispora sp. K20-0274 TaxID=3088255 RepID=UPI00399BAB12
MDPDRLRVALVAVPDRAWLIGALNRVAVEPRTIAGLYALAGRRCGTMALPQAPGWTADVAARVLLLSVLPLRGRALAEVIERLYRFGDVLERLAALRALSMLDVGPAAVPLLVEACASHDPRLLAAALGRYSAYLDDAAWRRAVLRCVATGVPLAAVHGLETRADAELARMLAAFVADRRLAGRHVPADAVALLHRLAAEHGTEAPPGEPATPGRAQGPPGRAERTPPGRGGPVT